MRFFLRLLVWSAIFVALTRARSPLTGRNEPKDQKRQSAYYSDGSEEEYYDTYGDVQVAKPVTDCVTSIAKTGIKRAFPKCKAYVKQVMEFCRSPNGKKTRGKDCRSVSVSVRIASDECDLLAEKRKPVSELCRTLVPPKKSKADCKPNQLFGPVPGSSTPRCFDAPRSKQSKTRILPIRMYRPFQSRNFAQLQSLTNFTQAQAYDSTTAHAQVRTEKVNVHILPIGQGDCTIIYCPAVTGHAILFDCGAVGGNYLPIGYFQSYFKFDWVESITVMISHGHRDHYNKIPKLFSDMSLFKKIKEVVVGGPKSDYSAKTISNWLKNIADSGVPVAHITGDSYSERHFCPGQDDIVFEIVSRHAKGSGDSKNEKGMVVKMSCKSCDSQLLFAGDMEGPTADDMVKHHSDFLRATHYKMAHHGAIDKANKGDWLKAISPVEVHISHRYNGQYDHPRCEAVDSVWPYLGTTAPIGGGSHDLDCIEKGGKIRHMPGIMHRIYSTAPTKNELCVIALKFAFDSDEMKKAITDVHCGKIGEFTGASPTVLPDPPLDDGEDPYD